MTQIPQPEQPGAMALWEEATDPALLNDNDERPIQLICTGGNAI